MNKKRLQYDYKAVGERLRSKREALGLSQEELAEAIDRATKYYSDIERGGCGMSIETMLSISDLLDISLDYMMKGNPTPEEKLQLECNEAALVHALSRCNDRQHAYAMRLLELFFAYNTTSDRNTE